MFLSVIQFSFFFHRFLFYYNFSFFIVIISSICVFLFSFAFFFIGIFLSLNHLSVLSLLFSSFPLHCSSPLFFSFLYFLNFPCLSPSFHLRPPLGIPSLITNTRLLSLSPSFVASSHCLSVCLSYPFFSSSIYLYLILSLLYLPVSRSLHSVLPFITFRLATNTSLSVILRSFFVSMIFFFFLVISSY